MKSAAKSRIGILLGVLAMAGFLYAALPAVSQTGWDHYQKALQLQKAEKNDEAIQELKAAIEKEPSNAYYLNALGLMYVDEGKFDDALPLLQKAVEIEPEKVPEAYSGLGVCYNAKKDYEKSVEMFKKSLALTPADSPDTAVIHNNIGQNYYLMKRYNDAETELKAALAANDKMITADINLGNVYIERGDYKSAVAYIEKAVELAPDYPLPRNNLAFTYLKLERYEDALKQMEEVLRLDPTNEQFKKNYEFLKQKKKEKDDNTYAEGTLKGLPKEITRKTEESGEAPQVSQPSAATEVAQAPASTEPAEPEKKEAAEQESSKPAPTHQIASLPEKTTETKKEPRLRTDTEPAAETKTEPASEVKTEPTAKQEPAAEVAKAEPAQPAEQPAEQPASQPATARLRTPVEEKKPEAQVAQKAESEKKSEPAKADKKKEEKKKAEKPAKPTKEELEKQKQLELAAAADKEAAEYYRAAKYNISKNRLDDADRDIERALKIHPDNVDYKVVQGMVLERRGFYHQAAAVYREVLDSAPDNSVARNSLGYVNQMMGRPEMAVEEYDKAVRADADNGCAAGNLGSMKVLMGDCDAGVELLTKAVEKKCLKPGVLNNISFCYFKKGDFPTAQELAHRALKLDPRDKTIVSNFSYIVDKSGLNYQPVHISRDTDLDTYENKEDADADIPLASLSQVSPLDYYQVFKNNYNKRKILVIPYENLPGTERWDPKPSEVYTKKLVKSLSESGYFDVIVPKEDLSFTTYREKTDEAFIAKMLKKYPADIVYIGKIGRQQMVDRENTRFKGLKKKAYVEGDYPVTTKLMLVEDGKTVLYDNDLTGTGYIDGAVSSTLSYREINDLKTRAFDNYCERMSALILDHFHLVQNPVRRGVVKSAYVNSDSIKFWR